MVASYVLLSIDGGVGFRRTEELLAVGAIDEPITIDTLGALQCYEYSLRASCHACNHGVSHFD